MLRYREIRPSAPLQEVIDSFWTLEHDGEGAMPQRVVPDGHPELILNLDHPFEFHRDGKWHGQPRCFLAGQIPGPLLLRPNGPAKILGIRLQPHGAAQWFDVPPDELSGRFTPVADLLPSLARDLDRALESRDTIGGIEAAILRAVRVSRGCDSLVAEAIHRIILARGTSDLAALAFELGIGQRQLERRFRATVGLTPKLFCRMRRFNHVFRAFEEQPRGWVDTALACGYYDQAHLIRDFKRLSGETPATLLAEDADLARHFLSRFGVSDFSNTASGRFA